MEKGTPVTIVLFGATGDLAGRKILPVLCALWEKEVFASGLQLLCFSRRPWTTKEYVEYIASSFSHFSEETKKHFLACLTYVEGNLDDSASYDQLATQITHKDVLYYFAVQPLLYERIAKEIARINRPGKLLFEKPFGHDENSARALGVTLTSLFPEHTLFLIDHYLAKEGLMEMVKKLSEKSELYEKIKRIGVKKVEALFFEKIDVASRGALYEQLGVLRDVMQNHLLLMLVSALGSIFSPEGLCTRAQVLESLDVLPESVRRAQYDGYRTEKDVSKDSSVETYVSFSLSSTLPEWKDTKFVLAAGKALSEKKSMITFLFADDSEVSFDMEMPKKRDAYEAVLIAARTEDRSLFVSFSEVFAAWKIVDRVRSFFEKSSLKTYQKGTIP